MDKLRAVWRGELPLHDVFWNWAVIGGVFVNTLSTALFLYLMLHDHSIWATILGYGSSVPYNVLVTVGVWRSAKHYTGDKSWADIAPVVTIVCMTLLSVS